MTILRTAAQMALEAMEYADACLKKQLTTKTKHEYAQDWLLEAGTALRAALAKPVQEPVQEPVAWMDIDRDGQRLTVRQWSDGNRDEVPLYTAPRKPLTDEEIEAVCAPLGFAKLRPVEVARAIERAHGISND